MKVKLTRKVTILLLLSLLVILIARPIVFLSITWIRDHEKTSRLVRPDHGNDASGLNATKIHERVLPAGTEQELIMQVSELVEQASNEGKKITIAGAGHSMGGHTIYPDGIVLDMSGFNKLVYNGKIGVLTVGSGARWSEVVPYLDTLNKSVAVMQSNNSFSVGGSVSVNCHGWNPGTPPISSTIKSLRLINSKGELLTCNRKQNAELFSLVLGGYGLFGVIVDVDLIVKDNALYEARQVKMDSKDYIKNFKSEVEGNNKVGMAYGRININKKGFLEQAILSSFLIKKEGSTELKNNGLKKLRRLIFRGSVGSDYGKELRWSFEKLMVPLINGRQFSRNQLMNEGVEVLENHDPGSTDILHEYFIPVDSVNKFINVLQSQVPSSNTDLLNITLRDVKKDKDSFLAYAREDVVGFVLLFNQQKTVRAEHDMEVLTKKLIDAAFLLNGTYYLPYRLHASKKQFQKVYPAGEDFFKLKDKYDPGHVFQNKFFLKYK
ncbi:MAG: FAD-binding oxidoreductase [Pedobacter sp.]|nr:MAG: FAD-binding oxidoreductase [Pedobacter sp.]